MTEHQFSTESYASRLSWEQNFQLLQPISPNRVSRTQGNSNVEAYDIRAHLNRVFGFGNWDGEAEVMELINENFGKSKDNTKDVISAYYRCRYTLRIRTIAGEPLATYTEWAMGDATNFPTFKYGDAHDFAMKTAESQALKRCAMNLGDQYGLSLYRKGSLEATVGWSLAMTPAPESAQAPQDQVPDVNVETDPDHGERPDADVAQAAAEGSQDEVYTPTPINRDQGSGTPALTPGEVERQFNEHYNAGNLDGLRALLTTARNAGMSEGILGAIRNGIAQGEAALGDTPPADGE